VLVYRLDDRLFFANARYFKARVREAVRAAPAEVSWLVFDAEAVTHADSTGLEALDTLTNDLRRVDITLVVARLRTRLQGAIRRRRRDRDDPVGAFLPLGARSRRRVRRTEQGHAVGPVSHCAASGPDLMPAG
jgi:sulfate permease, SulP family